MTLQLKIHINPEYQKLVPEIPAQEFAAIKADIKERGQLFPITVNAQGVILDGHHRYLEKLFVIDVNLKRRHLNSFSEGTIGAEGKADTRGACQNKQGS
jgi:ParB-like nuclease domain